MTDIILHHYPQSPVSEKVRIIFGIKHLNWRSVIIPRIPPKPDLIPLTGGYRQTPVMQIGADVYCDSQCIIRELERRFPEPTLFPGGSQGMAWGVSRWTDELLFNTVIAVVFAAPVNEMPEAFTKDRLSLYFRPDTTLDELRQSLEDNVASLRTQIGWMDERLSTRKFMLGAQPGLPDVLAYYLVWFLRGRYVKGSEFLSEFSFLNRWETDMVALGHGTSVDLSAEDALAIALAADSQTPERIDSISAQQFHTGQTVCVIPDNDSVTIRGQLHALSRDEVVITHRDDQVGTIALHFPRTGYRLKSEIKSVQPRA